eukprot:m.866213 g.866213  ORF g.866213 m.866213 type:complete len:138 (+) comp23552_c0_seq6:3478-3891(+)
MHPVVGSSPLDALVCHGWRSGPESLWEVIARCWRETLVDRWRFQDLVPALQKLLTTHGPPPPPRDIGALVTSGTLSYDAVLKGGTMGCHCALPAEPAADLGRIVSTDGGVFRCACVVNSNSRCGIVAGTRSACHGQH